MALRRWLRLALNLNVGWPFPPAVYLVLRRWLPRLYKKMNNEQRKFLKLCSAGVVKKGISKTTGKPVVSGTQVFLAEACNCLLGLG